MLEVFSKILSAIIISIVGAYIIRVITEKDKENLNFKNIGLILLLAINVALIYQFNYTALSTLIIFLLDIIFLK